MKIVVPCRTTLAAVVLLAAGVATAPTLYAQADWKIDAKHSSADFTVSTPTGAVDGSFRNVAGAVHWDDASPANSSVEATVGVGTISTANDKRDTHLKTPDFFDVAKFPSMTFKSTSVSKTDKGLKVEGDLTMHGVTKAVALEVAGMSGKPGQAKRKLTATTQLNRRDFGVGMGMAETMISDKVKVTLRLELVQ